MVCVLIVQVHYPELNDSKFIGMCIYNVALLSIPAVVLGVALDPGIDLRYAIGSTLVLLGTTVTQCIIFVPKVRLCQKLYCAQDMFVPEIRLWPWCACGLGRFKPEVC